MNKSPAFQFYPDKWQSHTRRLSDMAYRVYHEIMCWMWQHSPDQCSIDAKPEAISVCLGMPVDRISSAISEIQNPHDPLLKNRRGRLLSNGLRKEVKKQVQRRVQMSEAAKLRWGNNKQPMHKHIKTDAKAMHKVCSPSPSPSLIPTPSLSLNKTTTTLTPQSGFGGGSFEIKKGASTTEIIDALIALRPEHAKIARTVWEDKFKLNGATNEHFVEAANTFIKSDANRYEPYASPASYFAGILKKILENAGVETETYAEKMERIRRS